MSDWFCSDFNGVILNNAEALRRRIERNRGIILPQVDFSKKLVGQEFPNVSEGGMKKLLRLRDYLGALPELYDTDDMYDIPPIKGAVEGMHRVVEMGFKPLMVTNARSVSRDRINTWLAKHKFPKMDVVLTRRYRAKKPYQLKCAVVLDNEIEQLTPLLEHENGPRPIHYMPACDTTGYRAAVESKDPRIPSCRGWERVIAHLETLELPQAIAA